MAAQFESDERPDADSAAADDDAAALAALAHSVRLGRPIEPAEQLALLFGFRDLRYRRHVRGRQFRYRIVAQLRENEPLAAFDFIQ